MTYATDDWASGLDRKFIERGDSATRIDRRFARWRYTQMYVKRAGGKGLNATYFSVECAPSRALDEHLGDSSWAPPS